MVTVSQITSALNSQLNSSTSASADGMAQPSREAHYREQLFSFINRFLANPDQRAGVQHLTLMRGEKLSTETLGTGVQIADCELVILNGELSTSTKSGQVVFGAGYTILNPDGFLKRLAAEGATATSDKLEFLSIPRQTFNQWLSAEAGFQDAVATAIKAAHPQSRFPELTREAIRRARDENMRHVVFRDCISVVNKSGGVFDIINPKREPFIKHEFPPRLVSADEQAFLLVDSVSPVFLHTEEDEIMALAQKARQQADLIEGARESEKVGIAFQYLSVLLRSAAAQQVAGQLPSFSNCLKQERNYSELDWHEVTQRVLQIKWLEAVTGNDSKIDWDKLLVSELSKNSSDNTRALRSIRETLDQHMEPLVEAATNATPPKIARLGFRRFDAGVKIGNSGWSQDIELGEDAEEFRELRELSKRLESGDRSAVGGEEYVKRRFPLELLEGIVRDKIKVVFYDGPHRDAIEWARYKFGATDADPSVIRGCLEMEIAGTYGDFSRSWINFRNGESVLVVSQDGSPIRNAAALLLYRTENNETVSFENIYMVKHRYSLEARIKGDLEDLLSKEMLRVNSEGALGMKILAPEQLPTHLLILDRPSEFAELMRDHLELRNVPSKVLGNLRIGYWRTPSGEIRRIIMPTVGSRGLYGDSAGTFVKEFFRSAHILSPVPHVVFTASAGTFAGTDAQFSKLGLRGLKRGVERDALVAPSRSVTHKGRELHFKTLPSLVHELVGGAEAPQMLPQHTELAKLYNELQTKQRVARIAYTDKHFSVGAPAVETESLIMRMLETGHATVDVEGGPIAEAISSLGIPATFTPIYSSSDDPRAALEDESKSLAYGGILFDAKRPQPELNRVLRSLLLLSEMVSKKITI